MRKWVPRRALSVAAGLLAMVALGGAALAGDVTRRDKAGDVKAKGLTKAERDALDLVSVRAIGAESFGVLVVATFKGNVEQALGRGHLRNGLVAMILHPKSAAAKPAGLVTRGPGQGRTLRKTRSEDVGAVRQGRTIAFIVAGSGYSNVGSVEVKTFDKFLLGSARSPAGAPPGISDEVFDELLRTKSGRDTVRYNIDSKSLSCDELRRLKAILQKFLGILDGAVREDLVELRNDMKALHDKADAQLTDPNRRPPCEPPPVNPAPPPLPPTDRLGAKFVWTLYDSNEVAGSGMFTNSNSGSGRSIGRTTSGRFTGRARTITAVRVVVPPSGSTQRRITNFLCPRQLPAAAVNDNTIVCSGGTLATGETFTLNLQTSPVPTPGMGGQLFGQVDGVFAGPFAITGP